MLPPESTRDGPVCMSQHVNLLSCCRIPSSGIDIQRRSPIDQSCHIIVAHNGHVRVLDTVLEIMFGHLTKISTYFDMVNKMYALLVENLLRQHA